MPLFVQILLGIGGLLIAAMVAEAWMKRGAPKRSLAEKFKPGYDPDDDEPDKPELGMEATDMEALRISERGNRSAESFGARDFGFWSTQRRIKRRKSRKSPDKENQND